jgi:uncharacterized membrane protein YeiH
LKFDAVGLGVFTVIGATFAYNLFGLNLLIMTIAGTLTAVGGGIFRDMLVNEIPLVLVKELYASASFMGIIAFFILLAMGFNLNVVAIPSILLVILVRIIAMRFRWNLPRART